METHLKDTYGFNNFREYQKDIIQDLEKKAKKATNKIKKEL